MGNPSKSFLCTRKILTLLFSIDNIFTNHWWLHTGLMLYNPLHFYYKTEKGCWHGKRNWVYFPFYQTVKCNRWFHLMNVLI